MAQILLVDLRVHHHSAELITQELASFSSDAPGFVDYRARRIEFDRDCGQQHDWHAYNGKHRRDQKVDGAFYEESQSWDGPVIEFEHRNVADASEFRAQR